MRSFRTKTIRRCRPRHGQIAVEHLENLELEERNRVYKLLDLKLLAHEDGNLAVKWTLGGNLCRDKDPLPRWTSISATRDFRVHGVLSGGGSEEVELARV
jgi:hypothetical protein